jgi:hypothetical protein
VNNTCRYLFLEGKVLIDEAIKAANLRECIEIDRIFFTDNKLVYENEYLANKNLIKIDKNTLNKWTDVKTSQGLIGNFILF